MARVKRVAVIGAGPAGASAVDALAQEKAFDVIRVFERREKAGGCWLLDPKGHKQQIPDLERIVDRTADAPLAIPHNLPRYAPHDPQYRFSDTSIYDYLETNIDAKVMAFSQEPFPDEMSDASLQKYGAGAPFRHQRVVCQYIEDLLNRNGYQDFVEYNTTVERVEKVEESNEWKISLRKEGPAKQSDYWWIEYFDAVVVANGHYNVPYIPYIPGLGEFHRAYPTSVEHTKSFRGPTKYKGKRVVVGASISGPDVAAGLAGIAESPVHAVVRGRYHPYFGDWAFQNPHIQRHAPVSHISSSNGDRTVYFEDGTSLSNIDYIILGTGYSWTMHFMPDIEIRNNRVVDLYLHIFYMQDPTLVFVGGLAAGFTFQVYEWQAVLAARFLASRITLPATSVQKKWEQDRIALKGDGVPFTALYPDFENYFELVRKMAGEPREGQPGRRLPVFDKGLIERFEKGHVLRIRHWQRMNREAEERLSVDGPRL